VSDALLSLINCKEAQTHEENTSKEMAGEELRWLSGGGRVL
jgi:hypothetical protein